MDKCIQKKSITSMCSPQINICVTKDISAIVRHSFLSLFKKKSVSKCYGQQISAAFLKHLFSLLLQQPWKWQQKETWDIWMLPLLCPCHSVTPVRMKWINKMNEWMYWFNVFNVVFLTLGHIHDRHYLFITQV